LQAHRRWARRELKANAQGSVHYHRFPVRQLIVRVRGDGLDEQEPFRQLVTQRTVGAKSNQPLKASRVR
jgi:hypothetical protein